MVRAIGVGVNEWQVCARLGPRAPIDCVLLAGRYTLLEQEAAHEFLPLCVERGIGVIVGGPFNSGILATGPVEGAPLQLRAGAGRTSSKAVARIEAVSRGARRIAAGRGTGVPASPSGGRRR